MLTTKDPFVELAVALYPERFEIEERNKTHEGLRSKLAPPRTSARSCSTPGVASPRRQRDAPCVVRARRGGRRAGRPPLSPADDPRRDRGEKHAGKGDFDAPSREIDAIAALRSGKRSPYADAKLSDVPVNFLASVDTTGGNSGSPALNAKGELIGLLFDGTFDTVGSDVVFDPVRTRSILVDIRYVLWVMSEVDGATSLLAEMGIR